LRYSKHCDLEEIAKVLEMNETAIRVALSRARKMIRENMTKIHSYGIV
jgi:RNA polymerase sigma-70 factor (ECF subfamily)